MHPHIQRWHTRYRVIGESGGGAAFVEREVRARVAEAYATAVEQAFSADPAVYVLRRVRTDLTLVSPNSTSEPQTARRWAGRIFSSVVSTITKDAGHSDRVMRFEDTADYVAHFLCDLLSASAWERWYYGAFSAYRGLSSRDTFRRVLIDFADDLAAIFRRLAAMGRLDHVILSFPAEAAPDLWRKVLHRADRSSPEASRIFVRTALALGQAMGARASPRSSETELTTQFFRASSGEPDWKKPRALAEAVYSAFLFLERGGALAFEQPYDADRAMVQAERFINTLEWLDRQWLQASLQPTLARAAMPAPVVQVTRPALLSPLQRRVLDRLLQLLRREGGINLVADPAAAATAIALFAALCSADPALAEEPGTPRVIEWLLAGIARADPASSAAPLQINQRLNDRITSLLGPDKTVIPPIPFAPPPRQAVAPSLRSQARFLECSCAGLFLLARAILEGRVTQMAAVLGLPSAPVLLALAAEWSGIDPRAFDAGALRWAGCEGETADAESLIRSMDTSACELLCENVERLLRDRAVFAPSLAPSIEVGAAPMRAIASHLIRLWAYWLRGFGQASEVFLLNQLIRRGGSLRIDSREIMVHLRPSALDVVLQMAGYLKPVPSIPWLADRRLTFTIEPTP